MEDITDDDVDDDEVTEGVDEETDAAVVCSSAAQCRCRCRNIRNTIDVVTPQ